MCITLAGSVLASAGDGGELLLWRPTAEGAGAKKAALGADPDDTDPGWKAATSLRLAPRTQKCAAATISAVLSSRLQVTMLAGLNPASHGGA